MSKSLIKTIVALFIYCTLNFLLEKLFAFIFIRDFFLDVKTDYFLLINTFTYTLYIILAYFFIKKKEFSGSNELISFKNIFVVIVLIFSFRIFEDPIQRMEIIVDKLMIPDEVKNNSLSTINLAITFINTIIFAPLFEELFFKKIILSFFSRKKFLIGTILSSVAFSIIHVNWYSINSLQLIVFFLFGLVSCIIYLRYGLFHSVLFHSGYNLLWFLVNIGLIEYWAILKNLNFGIGYWGLVVLSIVSLSYYIFKFSKVLG